MIVRRQKRNDRYSIINNVPIEDKNLSAVSLGVYTYIMSKPDNWNAHKNEIYKRFEIANLKTSKNIIDSAFSELIKAGYIVLHTPMQRLENGQVRFLGKEYIFMDEPKTTESNSFSTNQDSGVSRITDSRELSTVESFRQSEELPYIVSTDLIINTNNKLNTDFNNKKENFISENQVKKVSKKNDIEMYPTNFTQQMIKASNDFFEYRKEVGKPFKSKKSQELRLSQWSQQIDAYGEQAVIESIESAIANQYQGTFIDKKYLNTQKPLIDDKGNYADTDAGREQFILDIRELAAKTFRK